MRIYVCVVGFKGEIFLARLLNQQVPIAKVFSYQQRGDRSNAFDRIVSYCRSASVQAIDNYRPTIADLQDADLIFVVGWQYLMSVSDTRLIVFHDSLLPRYRGFSPTVTSLIAGDDVVGVTAFSPTKDMDSGPILAQAQLRLRVPARIGDVLQRQSELMAELAVELIKAKAAGTLLARPQDETAASYSLWRDDEDYFIDWKWPAEHIQRFVYAVGYPYDGAHTILGDQTVIIDDCVVFPGNLAFPIRQPGKVWHLTEHGPIVTCGIGLLQILAMHTPNGTEYHLTKLRTRFRNLNESIVERRTSAGDPSDQIFDVSRTK